MSDKPIMLEGIRVVDLTTIVFGPYCTQILADLGAQVIKVESPGMGDSFRWSAPPAVTPGMSPAFMAMNRSKKSVTLDLKQKEDQAVMLDLLREADVFVVNVRGKALERIGLDPESLRKINPGLIYVHCVGFGQDGPYADLQAYDDVIQAATGTATLLPRVDGNPRPRYLPSLIADKVAGLHAAYATLAAIIHRLRNGEAQHVVVPMFETFAGFTLMEHLGGLSFDPPNGPPGYARQLEPDRQPFPTADGYVSIVAYSDDAWQRIFSLLDQPDFLEKEGLTTRDTRRAGNGKMYRAIAQFTPALPTAEIVRRCHAAQIPAQPVRDLADVIDDPHLRDVGLFQRKEHPTEGTWFEQRSAIRFSTPPSHNTSPPPVGGQDTEAVRAAGWEVFDEA